MPSSVTKKLDLNFFKEKLESMKPYMSDYEPFNFNRKSKFLKKVIGPKIGVFFRDFVISNTFKFSKRYKIFVNDSWVDTKPLVIDTLANNKEKQKKLSDKAIDKHQKSKSI